MTLPVSLLICSRGRPQLLLETVESILAGDALPTEMVLIDQSAEANTAVAAIGSRGGCEVRYIHTGEVGLSRGRNRAIREARQPLLVFTDDDMFVEPDWVATMAAAATAAGPRGLVCGRVLPALSDDDDGFAPSTIADLEPATHAGRIGKDVVFTGNLAIHRSAFEEVGAFDERLGPGTAYPGAEDSDLGFRLLEAGYTILYEPRAVVHHRAWRTWSTYIQLRWAYGMGMGGFLGKHLSLRGDRYMLRRFREDLWRHAWRAVRYAYCRSRHQTIGDLAYSAGLVVGTVRFRLLPGRAPRA